MLKWLVTKAPSSPSSLENVVTDDPLATLTRRGHKNEPIYAVSRVNPIFEEEDSKSIHNANSEENVETPNPNESEKDLPDSPPTDRESVRSSGYGSKEADSVSFKSDYQEEDEIGEASVKQELRKSNYNDTGNEPLAFDPPGTVAEMRKSFENLSSSDKSNQITTLVKTNQIQIISQNPNFVKSIEIGQPKFSDLEVIHEVSHESDGDSTLSKKSSWPRVSHLAQELQRQTERIHQRRERERLKQDTIEENPTNKAQVLRFNPLVRVVAQNENYVTAISVSPNSKFKTESISNDVLNTSHSGKNQYNLKNSNNFKLGAQSNIPSYLKTNSSNILNHEYPLISLQPDSLVNEDTLQMMHYPGYNMGKTEDAPGSHDRAVHHTDMPNFGRAVYSGFYSSINSGSSASQGSLGRKERNISSHSSAKKKGVNVVKDLWEKTGLKTNGRKLLVDVNDLLNEGQPMPLSRKSSYDSTEDYNSLHSISEGNNSSQFRRKRDAVRTISGRSSDIYGHVSTLPHGSSFPHTSSSLTHSYEEIPELDKGIDNIGFLDDRGCARDSATSSIHSKSGHQFQHNLTEFQRRVSERLQGEPSHRKSLLELENGGPSTSKESENENFFIKSIIPRTKDSKNSSKKSKQHPGKAIRELGLDGDWKRSNWKENVDNEYSIRANASPWTLSNNNNVNNHPSGSFGNKNRLQIWDKFYGRYKDGSIPGYFYPHPNSEAPMSAHRSGFLHDFTLDAKKSQRIMKKSSQSKRRKRCCLGVVVLLAFLVFIGAIVGMSWYSTGGERIFGPM